MKIYLAGTYSQSHYIYDEFMKIFLAGNKPWINDGIYNEQIEKYRPNILESYYDLRGDDEYYKILRPFFGDFLLDSGAFTFMQGTDKQSNWAEYAKGYANYIKSNGITKYFELDLDSLMTIDKVEDLRKLIEDITGIPSIPVWHKSRGLEYWHRIAEDYRYIAIGGIVSGEIKRNEYKVFHKLLSVAHKAGTKVHGLGFTNMQGMKEYKFDTVDSTAWLYGNRGGFIYKFNGQYLLKYYQKDKRMKGKAAAIHNFTEWVKFSKFVESNY